MKIISFSQNQQLYIHKDFKANMKLDVCSLQREVLYRTASLNRYFLSYLNIYI